MGDKIFIEDLRVRTRIGAMAAERRKPQTVAVSIEIPFSLGKASRTDRLADSVDYEAVSKVVDKVARARTRRLAERLAADISREVANIFGVKRVKVSVKKFILKRTRFAGVQLTVGGDR
jgi:7,8-dihydroneopterin aldolase/epimerase/oxygenase